MYKKVLLKRIFCQIINFTKKLFAKLNSEKFCLKYIFFKICQPSIADVLDYLPDCDGGDGVELQYGGEVEGPVPTPVRRADPQQ